MLNHQQKTAIESQANRIIIDASAGTGKSLKNGTLVLSINGWIPIEKLLINDKVAASDGNFYNVLGVFPQVPQKTYKIIFSDRSEIFCSADHLWIYQNAYMRDNKKYGVKTLQEIIESVPLKIPSGKTFKNNCYIPIVKPVQFNKKDIPLNPYLLGCLLGDGGLSGKGIVFTVAEEDIKDNINQILEEYDCSLQYLSKYDYQITGKVGFGYHNTQNRIGASIKELGLSHSNSSNKFIPDIYKYNSVEVRLEILKGIIDTDGFCEGSSYDITLKSKQLILDIKEICQSLGMTATYSEKMSKCATAGYEKDCGIVYRLHIKTSFEHPKIHKSIKREKQWKKGQSYARRYIESIIPLNEYSDMTCISVDSPDHSFVCQDFIVTHNTSTIIAAAEQHRFGSTILITFTNKAAEEMQSRISYKPAHIGTIHSLAYKELMKLAKKLDFRVRILKEASVRKIIKLIFDENDLGIYVSNVVLGEAFQYIASESGGFDSRKTKIFSEVRRLYNKYKEQNQLYDITDTPKYLLKKLQDYKLTLNYDLVLVDEAQDLDQVQYDLIQLLGRRIIVIGDPRQSIYMFRGATAAIFNRFIEDGYELHTLTTNYRSKQEIIDNVALELHCERGYGGMVMNDLTIFKYGPQILCRTNREADEIRRYYPSVMTVHAAKGLEFSNVCVIDFPVETEEEQNIMFVALTRARDRVAVLKYQNVIRFLFDFESNL